jgi:hypothetical protein
MAIYVGEGITILCAAKNPATGVAIADAIAVVEFYAPGKNPAKVVGDRTVDHGPFAMSYDATVVNSDGSKGGYAAYVDTTGWDAGKWTYRVVLAGAYESWEYASVRLLA